MKYIFPLILLIVLNINAQVNKGRMLKIEIETINKNDSIPIQSMICISSNNKVIGIKSTDFEGYTSFNICSKKIFENKISVEIYGLKCKSITREYKISNDISILEKLEYGRTIYNEINDQTKLYTKFGIPFCNIEKVSELTDDDLYQHCDGRIKLKKNIPDEELFEWEVIKKCP